MDALIQIFIMLANTANMLVIIWFIIGLLFSFNVIGRDNQFFVAVHDAIARLFEPVLRRREPAVEAAFAALSDIGTARLTGSGSGCFVEFATRAAAEQGLARLPKELRAWVAAGVERSPLLDVLERY